MPKKKDSQNEPDYLDQLVEVDSFPSRAGDNSFLADSSIVRSIITYSSEEFEVELLNRQVQIFMSGANAEEFSMMASSKLDPVD